MTSPAFPSSFKPIQQQNIQQQFPSSFKPLEENKEKQKSEEEPWWKSAIRTGYQPISGFLNTTTPGIAANFWHLLATGEAFDPEEIDRIEAIAQREGVPFDRDKYTEAAKTALSYIPTLGNIERGIEEKTGAPLEAKTRLQKGIKFATEAGRLAPQPGTFIGSKTAFTKPILGAGVEAAKEGLIELGVPEPFAEPLAFGILRVPQNATEAIGPTIEISKKPSGLTERRFESLEKPIKVSPARFQKINESLEKDFRKISEDLFANSSISETRKNLKESADFKNKASESFQKVQDFASKIPDKIPATDVQNSILNKINEKKHTGFVPGEYQETYDKFINDYLKKMQGKEISNQDLIGQYRSNNKELGQIYEHGKSTAYNNGKKDALLDFNRSIADVIEKKYPKTEYAELFKKSNDQWSNIMDSEKIDKFLDGLFEGKIRYEKGKRFFEKEGVSRPFERSLGKEGFSDFKDLLSDLMSTKQGMSLIKIAENRGFTDFAKTAGAYLLHPDLLKGKFALDLAKEAYKAALDKPKLTIKWKKGIEQAKKGNFQEAQKSFNEITKKTNQ